jgi:sirohydrochlorin cobaltochelatase
MRSRAVRFHWSLFAAALLCLCLSAPAFAGEHGKAPEAKRGILLVAFGTSVPEAAASIDELTRQAKAAFPGVPVRLAYSSKIIRDKIAGEGVQKRSPAQALADMAAEGFTEVAVQSLHSIPGREFTDISATAKAFEGMPKSMGTISVGRPLLSTPEDIALAAQAVLKSLPQRGRGEAVVLMGPRHRASGQRGLLRPAAGTVGRRIPACSWPRWKAAPAWRTSSRPSSAWARAPCTCCR